MLEESRLEGKKEVFSLLENWMLIGKRMRD
jgi:hypothetical protein